MTTAGTLGQLLVATGSARDSEVSPGLLGFAVVALLGVATWLLFRSMNKQFRKIDLPRDDEPGGRESTGKPDDGPSGQG